VTVTPMTRPRRQPELGAVRRQRHDLPAGRAKGRATFSSTVRPPYGLLKTACSQPTIYDSLHHDNVSFGLCPRPPGAVKHPWRHRETFPYVTRFSMVFLYGRARRLTAKNGGFRPGQTPTPRAALARTPSSTASAGTRSAASRTRSSTRMPPRARWGLGRILAFHHRSSTLYQIREHTVCLCF
jgi:hypothetical protein